MAREFPEAEVWGVDRPHVQTIWTEEAPTNCHFETHQTYNFLSEHSSEFDLIHMRFVAGGCEQFLKTLTDIHACLKPGGIFILVDSTGDILAEDGMSVLRMKSKRYPEGSRLRRMFFGGLTLKQMSNQPLTVHVQKFTMQIATSGSMRT
jgi:hypothetical protein